MLILVTYDVSTETPEGQSLRFYSLGKNYQSKVEHYGAKPSYDVEGVLIF